MLPVTIMPMTPVLIALSWSESLLTDASHSPDVAHPRQATILLQVDLIEKCCFTWLRTR